MGLKMSLRWLLIRKIIKEEIVDRKLKIPYSLE
jgi:hypothetical protein